MKAPAVRAGILKHIARLVRERSQNATGPVEAAGPAALALLGDRSWVPLHHQVAMFDAIAQVGGVALVDELLEGAGSNWGSTLLSSILATARLVGSGPQQLFRAAPMGWRVSIRDAGELHLAETTPGHTLVVLTNAWPQALRSEAWCAAFCASVIGVARDFGAIHAEGTLAHVPGGLTVDIQWNLGDPGAPLEAGTPPDG